MSKDTEMTKGQVAQLGAKFLQVLPLDANRAEVQKMIENDNDPLWVAIIERFAAKVVGSPKPIEVERVRVIDGLTIEVDLDAPVTLPFPHAEVANEPKGKGWVRVQRRGEDIFADDKKVELFVSERQQGGRIRGRDLRTEVEAKSPLHPNIMDALCEHQHLVPDRLKKDEKGNTFDVFFWDVIFVSLTSRLYVRYLQWDGSACNKCYRSIDEGWGAKSLVCASAS